LANLISIIFMDLHPWHDDALQYTKFKLFMQETLILYPL